MRYNLTEDGGSNDILQSQTINFLRFPLTVLVIYIHSFGEPLFDNPNIDIVVYDNIRIFFSHIISRVAVPTFLVISGYLFFYNVDEFSNYIYWKKLRSRFKSIFIPYILWNLVLIVPRIIVKIVKIIIYHENGSILFDFFQEYGWLNILWSCNEWPFRISWYGWNITTSGPILIPMWYLRDLFVAFILSWIIWKIIKLFGRWIVAFILFCDISGLWPNIPGLEIYSISFLCLEHIWQLTKLIWFRVLGSTVNRFLS